MTTDSRLPWRKSSYSSNGGSSCVEVAPRTNGVVIRHSKRPADGIIEFTAVDWTAFIADATAGRLPGGPVTVTRINTDTLVSADGVTLRYDKAEWDAFTAGAADGEFTFR